MQLFRTSEFVDLLLETAKLEASLPRRRNQKCSHGYIDNTTDILQPSKICLKMKTVASVITSPLSLHPVEVQAPVRDFQAHLFARCWNP